MNTTHSANAVPRTDRAGRGTPAGDEWAALPAGTPALPPAATFAELELPAQVHDVLTRLGVDTPFPIQSATLPTSTPSSASLSVRDPPRRPRGP